MMSRVVRIQDVISPERLKSQWKEQKETAPSKKLLELNALESKITWQELTELMESQGEKEISLETIEPFIQFLKQRWQRISRTDLVYPHSP